MEKKKRETFVQILLEWHIVPKVKITLGIQGYPIVSPTETVYYKKRRINVTINNSPQTKFWLHCHLLGFFFKESGVLGHL